MNPPTNTTKIWDLLTFYNVETNGWMGNMFLLALFVCLFMILLRRSVPEAVTGAGFITSLIAFFMFNLGLISEFALVLPIVITIVGTAALFYRS